MYFLQCKNYGNCLSSFNFGAKFPWNQHCVRTILQWHCFDEFLFHLRGKLNNLHTHSVKITKMYSLSCIHTATAEAWKLFSQFCEILQKTRQIEVSCINVNKIPPQLFVIVLTFLAVSALFERYLRKNAKCVFMISDQIFCLE